MSLLIAVVREDACVLAADSRGVLTAGAAVIQTRDDLNKVRTIADGFAAATGDHALGDAGLDLLGSLGRCSRHRAEMELRRLADGFRLPHRDSCWLVIRWKDSGPVLERFATNDAAATGGPGDHLITWPEAPQLDLYKRFLTELGQATTGAEVVRVAAALIARMADRSARVGGEAKVGILLRRPHGVSPGFFNGSPRALATSLTDEALEQVWSELDQVDREHPIQAGR